MTYNFWKSRDAIDPELANVTLPTGKKCGHCGKKCKLRGDGCQVQYYCNKECANSDEKQKNDTCSQQQTQTTMSMTETARLMCYVPFRLSVNKAP